MNARSSSSITVWTIRSSIRSARRRVSNWSCSRRLPSLYTAIPESYEQACRSGVSWTPERARPTSRTVWSDRAARRRSSPTARCTQREIGMAVRGDADLGLRDSPAAPGGTEPVAVSSREAPGGRLGLRRRVQPRRPRGPVASPRRARRRHGSPRGVARGVVQPSGSRPSVAHCAPAGRSTAKHHEAAGCCELRAGQAEAPTCFSATRTYGGVCSVPSKRPCSASSRSIVLGNGVYVQRALLVDERPRRPGCSRTRRPTTGWRSGPSRGRTGMRAPDRIPAGRRVDPVPHAAVAGGRHPYGVLLVSSRSNAYPATAPQKTKTATATPSIASGRGPGQPEADRADTIPQRATKTPAGRPPDWSWINR